MPSWIIQPALLSAYLSSSLSVVLRIIIVSYLERQEQEESERGKKKTIAINHAVSHQ
jgi:hypothetical protein